MKECIQKYHGSAGKYIREYIIPFLPLPENIIRYNKSLQLYLQNPDLYIVRKSAKYNLRGNKFILDKAEFIPSDNEAAFWYYMECYLGHSHDFKELVESQSFPIAFALKKNEKEKNIWKKRGRVHTDFSEAGWKHCHVLACSPRNVEIRNESDLRVRMLRLFSPFNHFPFPGPRKYLMTKDWGENADFISLLVWILCNEHYKGEANIAFKEFLNGAAGTLNSNSDSPKDFEIDFVFKKDRVEKFQALSIFNGKEKFSCKVKSRKGEDKVVEKDLDEYISSDESFYSIPKTGKKDAFKFGDFIHLLGDWVEYTDEETISNGSSLVGINPWVYTIYGSSKTMLHLNSDSTREGVIKFLEQYKKCSKLKVVKNQKQKFNKVIAGDTVPGFYLYTGKTYEHEQVIE